VPQEGFEPPTPSLRISGSIHRRSMKEFEIVGRSPLNAEL
jgi:hypothetical protein